jgi:hypothetical protein
VVIECAVHASAAQPPNQNHGQVHLGALKCCECVQIGDVTHMFPNEQRMVPVS